MSAKQNTSLMGRIAIQLKMITMEQLREATAEQARHGEQRLGQVLLGMGYIDEAQLEKLKTVQRDVVTRHRAKQAVQGERATPGPAVEPPTPAVEAAAPAAGRSAPEAAAPSAAPIADPVGKPPAQAAPTSPSLDIPAPVMEQPAAKAQAQVPAPNRSAAASSPAQEPIPVAPSPAAPSPAAPSPAAAPPAAAPHAPTQPSRPESAAAAQAPAPQPAQVAHVAVQAGPPSLELQLPEPSEQDRDRLHGLLRQAAEAGASDIHIHADASPVFRVSGALVSASPTPLTRAEAEGMVSAALTPEQRERVKCDGEIDICYAVTGIGRFRTNLYRHQRGFDVVMRSIPAEPPTLDQLRLPNELAKYTNYHQGMVLITGPAGCGKSSTMAALVNLINEERDEHILTIEDPIEVVHPSKRCLVNQRHAGAHTASFARALRGALREDPDVIVIGELRDLETISLAMTAAETGHFVLATLHTNNAVRTINRMIGAFPSNEQDQVRTMLSESLRAVISQRLVPTADSSGRLPALEVLVINKAIGNLIRDGKTVQIRSSIQTGKAHGMYLLEQSLNEMVRAGDITKEEALRYAEDEKLITG